MRGSYWVFALVPVAVLLGVVIIGLLAVSLSRLMFSAFAQGSGLSVLVKRYGADGPPAGERLTRQSVQIGEVRYRRCVQVVVADDGLYLDILSNVRGGGRVQIPWCDLRVAGEKQSYWQSATRLAVGEPVVAWIAVLPSLQKWIAPHLDQPRA